MANGDGPDYRDFKIGELNSLGFRPDDLLISDGASGADLLKQALNRAYERTSTFDNKLLRAEVLLARQVSSAGPGLVSAILDRIGWNTQRYFAICRIPEIHASIEKPDINRVANGDITPRDKMLLSMHGRYYTSPDENWIHGALNPGDIVLVNKEGIIISIEEKSKFNLPDKGNNISARGAFRNAPYSVRASDASLNASPNTSAFVEEMKNSDLGNFSEEFLLGLAANAQQESGLCASNAGDLRGDISGDGENAIYAPNCSNEEGYYCSFGYWQLNICSSGAGGQRFAAYYRIDLNDREELYRAITDSNKQFEFMYSDMQELFGDAVFKSEVTDGGVTYAGEDLARYWGGRIAKEFENCAKCGGPSSTGDEEYIARQTIAAEMYRDGAHMSAVGPTQTSR